MNELRLAAEQALEFLESGNFVYPSKLASALREALAESEWEEDNGMSIAEIFAKQEALAEQAEQEPVAWYSVKGGFNTCGEGKPLYAAPVRTKDLSDDEIWEIWFKDITLDWDERCRAAIAADREKNK